MSVCELSVRLSTLKHFDRCTPTQSFHKKDPDLKLSVEKISKELNKKALYIPNGSIDDSAPAKQHLFPPSSTVTSHGAVNGRTFMCHYLFPGTMRAI